MGTAERGISGSGTGDGGLGAWQRAGARAAAPWRLVACGRMGGGALRRAGGRATVAWARGGVRADGRRRPGRLAACGRRRRAGDGAACEQVSSFF
jgi:hypothetical protein